VGLADPALNSKIESFRYDDYKITNYEMEGSAIAGLAKLMGGHRAMTVCCVIANRRISTANTDYTPYIKQLIQKVLDRI
jgi:uridine phosphorylase